MNYLPKGDLDRQIGVQGGSPIELVVCGGTALAAVDRDDYHVQDLLALNPTEKEIEYAAKWTLTQDVSEESKSILRDFPRKTDDGNIAEEV